MLILIIIIICLGIIAALAGKLSAKDDSGVTERQQGDCATCGGGQCMHDCMAEAAVKDIEYYDDEELDGFKGRPSDRYTDDEAEQFREVMLTMRQDEVAGWARSLAMRGIVPPDQIKDEMIMLMAD